MTILDAIVENKRMEVLKRKRQVPLKTLETRDLFDRKPLDPLPLLKKDHPTIIAEFKRKSPSRGIISEDLNPERVVTGYNNAGAAACSILTDKSFFGGSVQDLVAARQAVPGVPLLRKDFMIDPYQVVEARSAGADMILLISAILERNRVKELAKLAASLGMQVLFEVHNHVELDSWIPEIGIIGVNNRDLKTFTVDTGISESLVNRMPEEVVRVSESGLSDPEQVRRLHSVGFDSFLMGERFMREQDPGSSLRDFIKSVID